MSDTTPRDRLADLIECAETDIFATPTMTPPADRLATAILAAGWRPPVRVVTTEEEINGTHVREVVFDGHSTVPGTPARVLEDFGLTVHLWDGTFTGDLGDGRAGWTSATVETGRRMVTVRHGETLRVLVDQTGRATGIVVPVDYGEDQ